MSDEYTAGQENPPTPESPLPPEPETPAAPSPAEGEPGSGDPAASNPAAFTGPPALPTDPDFPDPAPTPDVVTTADDVTRPAVTAAQPTAPGIPDETHNSIDPQTGALTAEALSRRDEITRIVQEAGHAVGSFEEALKHWLEMEAAKPFASDG